MKTLMRSILFGGAAAIALVAGSASAHDVERVRQPVAVAPAPLRPAHWDRERLHHPWRERRELAARERFYRWHGHRHHDGFGRPYAADHRDRR